MQIKTFGPYTFPTGTLINTPVMMDEIQNSLLSDGWLVFATTCIPVRRFFNRSLQMYFHCKPR